MAFTIGQIRNARRPLVMGIVNVTPDSFSGDGLMRRDDHVAAALEQAQTMIQDGADMLDIGGESTRPGHTPVSAAEEIRRTVPIIGALKETTSIPLAIDTTKAEVAKAALDAGADIVNDISALRADPTMGPLLAMRGVPVILMHNRSRMADYTQSAGIGGSYAAPNYADFLPEFMRDLEGMIDQAHKEGVRDENIILDPGLGFGKTVPQNLALIRHCDQIAALGYPVLLGASRKSFIGQVLGTSPEGRLGGSLAAALIGWQGGATIFRVHDVQATRRALDMATAIAMFPGA